MCDISHYNLCVKTAEKFYNKSDIVLIDFQVMGARENPDVLCFKGSYSTLFEIKVSRSDFFSDAKKESRISYDVKYWPRLCRSENKEIKKMIWGNPDMKEFIKEFPHLGTERYYVCPKGIITAEEVGRWGLYYYYENGRFRKIKESSRFKRDLLLENAILVNALRYYNHGNPDYDKSKNILRN